MAFNISIALTNVETVRTHALGHRRHNHNNESAELLNVECEAISNTNKNKDAAQETRVRYVDPNTMTFEPAWLRIYIYMYANICFYVIISIYEKTDTCIYVCRLSVRTHSKWWNT